MMNRIFLADILLMRPDGKFMIICFTLFCIYAVSVLTCTFSVFRLNPSIRRLIDKAEAFATLSLLELAELSDNEALLALRRYLLIASGTLFMFANIVAHVFGPNRAGGLIICSFVGFYLAASIGSWSNNRAEITRKFMEKAIKDSSRYAKYYLILSLFILLIFIGISASIGEFAVSHLEPIILALALGLAVILVSITVANSISLAFVFGPALLFIAYLWLVIFVAKGALAVGKNHLINVLGTYCVIGTIYLALLSLPGLRYWLGIPAICQ